MRNALLALVVALAACDASSSSPAPGKMQPANLPKFEPSSGGKMVKIPAGDFYMDVTPVTQELYQKVMGVNPSKQKNPQAPVAGVQWVDAARFCNKCSEMEGLKPCYDLKTWDCDLAADGFRLPSEEEWEVACRGMMPDRIPFPGGVSQLGRYAWTKANS